MRRALRKQLMQSIADGDIVEVRTLLDQHPTLADARNSHGNSPIREAISARRLDIVKLLIDRGANPKQANGGGVTLMDSAAWNGSVPIARFLVDCGCGLTAGHAAQLGLMTDLAGILESDANAIDQRDRINASPLHAAAIRDQVEAARLLLEHGADVNAIDDNDIPPLGYAVEKNALAVAELLLDHGADPNGRAGHFEGTALHRAIVHRSMEMARLLLEHGADPNRQDYAGKTTLHEAVVSGKLTFIDLVLEYNPDLSLKTWKAPTQPGDETALDYARRRKKKRIVERLEACTGGAASPRERRK